MKKNRFDTLPLCFQVAWKISDLIRALVCHLPFSLRYFVSQILAALVYWPLARTALLLEKIYQPVPSWPLFYYRNKSFYVLRTDALDRFGTCLEQRFTQTEIKTMLENAGFEKIQFLDTAPFLCASGIKTKLK